MNRVIFDPTLNWLVTFIASFLIWLMVFIFITFYGIKKKVKKDIIVRVILSTSIAWILSEVLKKLIPSIRPFNLNGYPPLTITIPTDSSFPSSHTSAAFAFAISLFFYKTEVGFAFLLGAITVAVGRILANVHFIKDILGGIVLGGMSALLVNFFYKRRDNKKK